MTIINENAISPYKALFLLHNEENIMKRSIYLVLLGILVLAMTACSAGADQKTASEVNEGNQSAPVEEETSSDENSATAEETTPELFGDSLRGGLLYDKWWKPLGLDAPESDHPLWSTQTSNTRSGDATWRCKECHGWDYMGADGAYSSGSHFTGFVGVIQMFGGDPGEVFSALQGATNPDHDFSDVMDEQALTDLALFISQELVDYSQMIGEDKAALGTDLALGNDLYQETCSECHGPEGLAVNFAKVVTDPDYVAGIATGNPWEFLHKSRFGQPGTEMPSVIDSGWSLEEQGALLAYAQTLPNESLVTQGGLMWDKWWKAMGIDAPEGDQSLWAAQSSNERDGDTTWRCKECHGWDYKGADGAYASGSHFTGFAGVYDTTADLLSWLNGSANTDHDFSAYMDDAAMNMMVEFIQNGLIDMSVYINADKTVNADSADGQALYEIGCARCHGDDGQAINFDEDDPTYLSDVANSNPWETLHKAANGQPGTNMPSGFNLGWSWEDLAAVVSYIQTLP
jgi:mono/diheme cytochrome c family protein